MSAIRELPKAPPTAALQFFRDPHAFVTEAPVRYGDIFVLEAGLARVAVVSHPLLITQILRDKAKNFPKEGSMWDALRSLLGDGLLTSHTNDHWRRHRRMMHPHFHGERLTAITEKIAAAIEEVVDTLDERARGPVDMNVLCAEITMNVIVRVVFGTALDDEDVPTVVTTLEHILEYMVRGMLLQALPAWFPVPGRARYMEHLKTLDGIVYKMIDKRRRGTKGDDLLTMLLEMVDEETGSVMSNEELRDEVLTLLLAGYETTATSTAWAFHELSRRPEMAQRIRDEVNELTFGERPGAAHISRLAYTRMFMKETLRCYPIAWQIMRRAVEDDEIGGFRIPAGTQMMLSFCGAHSHPDYWPEPKRFDPLRFTPEHEKARPREAWMPFGAGQRFCIGSELAMVESSLILPIVLQRFGLSPLPGRAPREKVTLVLGTQDGTWLRLDPLRRRSGVDSMRSPVSRAFAAST